MSACSYFATASSACLLTDAGYYLEDGSRTVVGIAPKAVLLPDLNAAIGFAGNIWVGQMLPAVLARTTASGFDDLASGLADVARAVEDEIGKLGVERLGKPVAPGRFRLVLAGWSDGVDAPAGHVVENLDGDGTKAFEAVEADACLSPPVPLPAIHDDNLTESCRTIAEAQRKAGGGLVAGYMTLTRILKDRIETRIVARWPDRIGQPTAA